jgi:manganese/zinc/iron transport system permease protein
VLSFQGGYNTNVVLFGTILLGISAGAVGSFAMLKGRALVADAISHASLVGVALAFLLHSALGQQERSMPLLMLGAAVSGACAVVAIEWISKHTRLSPETAVATVSSSSFGAGIVALSATRRVEGADRAGLDELIFGSTASMTRADALLMAGLAAAALGATLALYRVLTAVAFNERFARSKGLPVRLLDAVLAALVGAVAMAGLQAVGMLLVAALLVAPAATARLWTTRVAPMVLVAAAAGAGAAWVGASFSAVTPGAPAGPLIILSAASTFMLSLLIAPERGLLSGWLRHRRIAAAARRVAATEGQPRPGGEAS